MADEPELLVEDAEGVRTLTLNRPDRLNALTIPLRLAIQRAVEEFDAVDDLRVLVITGAGRGFCAGSDLTGGQEPAEPERLRDHARLRFGWHLPLDRTDKPTIAAVNGVAAG
ncbi:MAG: enoyl-CoA hydratase/isomerase family protein, partial [Dehalococcoidia bacterium]|nr:enoyl-CoA hydratase/isomerase family protein [Dehalococcoidia bacterium]